MSALSAAARALPSGMARAARPLLRVVPRATARAPRVPFVLLVVLLLGGGLVGLLAVNTSLQQGAFAVHDLERRTAVLGERRQELAESLALVEAPAALATRASALGMVPVATPVFLRLNDGKVLGTPVPAKAAPIPVAPEPKPVKAAKKPAQKTAKTAKTAKLAKKTAKTAKLVKPATGATAPKPAASPTGTGQRGRA